MKYIVITLALGVAALFSGCTANSTVLSDTAASLNPSATSSASSADEVLAKVTDVVAEMTGWDGSLPRKPSNFFTMYVMLNFGTSFR